MITKNKDDDDSEIPSEVLEEKIDGYVKAMVSKTFFWSDFLRGLR